MITIILVLIILLLIIHYCVLHYSHAGRLIDLIPGPRTWPIFGNTITLCVPLEKLWILLWQMSKEYYPIFKFWQFLSPTVVITHPDDMKVILAGSKHTSKSDHYKYSHAWVGTGLVTSSGAKWQTRRKLITPAFHTNILENFVDIFNKYSQDLCQALKQEGVPVVKDLSQLFGEPTLNIICETAMGCCLQDQGDYLYKYHNAADEIGQLIVDRMVRPWLDYDFVYGLTFQGWRQSRVLKILHGFTKLIIEERKKFHNHITGQYFTGNGDDGVKDEYYNGSRKMKLAFLDLLIAAQKNGLIDDEGIREEVDTFMFAGHHTVASALCFTIMILAEHKQIQDRAREEFDTMLRENGGKITMSALQQLPYLEGCIKESLRLYPPVHSIFRTTEEETVLSGYTVPAGVSVQLLIMVVHRDPNFWPNPDVFDPDRFLPENIAARHPYSYLPFSAGPRHCVGKRFAMLEMKTVIGLLLHNFHFQPVDYLKDVTFLLNLVTQSKYPLRTRFIPIQCG